MEIDYEAQADIYERTRGVESLVYSVLSALLRPRKGDKILDFGCGTGNYLCQFVSDYQIDPYGIEPATQMRLIAQGKLPAQCIRNGDHTHLPFPGLHFDKLYCIDVIHHIRQLNDLFLNLFDAAKPGAKFCICTESPHQLSEKYWIRYFPEILEADLQRFYPIQEIVKSGQAAGWEHCETITTEDELLAAISPNFIARVRHKTLSVFHLIPEDAYKRGLALMEADYQAQLPLLQREGYTFILFERRQ